MSNDREDAINYLADSGKYEIVLTVKIRLAEGGFSRSIEVTLAELKTLLESGEKEFIKKRYLEAQATHVLTGMAFSLRQYSG